MMDLPGADTYVVVHGFRGAWRALPLPPRPAMAAMLAENQYDALVAAWSHLHTPGAETMIAEARRVDDEMRSTWSAEGFAIMDREGQHAATGARAAQRGRLWLLTSGSTGRPKRVPYSFDQLIASASTAAPRRWLMAYSPGSFAWWQIVSLSLTQPGQELVAISADERAFWPDIAAREQVTAVSGTPTFWWRALLQHGRQLSRLPIEQISLGGEPVEQTLLDRLHETLPRARLWWAYASTEHGRSIVVRDGRAGFPVQWLQQRKPGQPALRIVQGELWLEAPPGSGEFHRTGDCASIIGERVMLTGRLRADEINVGGAKINASTIHGVLSRHPAVAWARLQARRAPLLGQVPVAEVVLQTPVPTTELRRWCAERLPDYGVPRQIRILSEIPETLAGKSHV
jgi:acyl-CoA synthetase (AMP-forming)/AMP-acid ligase II